MTLSKDEVMSIVKRFLAQCAKKHDVKEAYLFGSFAKGRAEEYSNIDLAIITGSLRQSRMYFLTRSLRYFMKPSNMTLDWKWLVLRKRDSVEI